MEEIIAFAYSSKDNVPNDGNNMQQKAGTGGWEIKSLAASRKDRESDLEVDQNCRPTNPVFGDIVPIARLHVVHLPNQHHQASVHKHEQTWVKHFFNQTITEFFRTWELLSTANIKRKNTKMLETKATTPWHVQQHSNRLTNFYI